MPLRVNGICRGRLDECAHRRCTARFCHAILYRRIESTRLVGHDVTHLDMSTFWRNVKKNYPFIRDDPIVGGESSLTLYRAPDGTARQLRTGNPRSRTPKIFRTTLSDWSRMNSGFFEIIKERTRMTPFVGQNLLRDTWGWVWRMSSFSLAVHLMDTFA